MHSSTAGSTPGASINLYSIDLRDADGQPLRGVAANIINLLKKLLENGGRIGDSQQVNTFPSSIPNTFPSSIPGASQPHYSDNIKYTVELSLEQCNAGNTSRLRLSGETTLKVKRYFTSSSSQLDSNLKASGTVRDLGQLLMESIAMGISSASIRIETDHEKEHISLKPQRGLERERYGLGVLDLNLGVGFGGPEDRVKVRIPVALPDAASSACVSVQGQDCLMKPVTLPPSLVASNEFEGMLESIKGELRVCGGGNVNRGDTCVERAVELFNSTARLYRVNIEDVDVQASGGAPPSLRVKGWLEPVNDSVDLYCRVNDPKVNTCTKLAELVAAWTLDGGISVGSPYPDVTMHPVSPDTLVFSPRAGGQGARSLLPLCSLAKAMKNGYTVPLYVVTNVEPASQGRLGLGTFSALLKGGLAWFIPCPARAEGVCDWNSRFNLAEKLDAIYEECSKKGLRVTVGGDCTVDITKNTDYMLYKGSCVLVDFESALRTYADRTNCSIASKLV